MKNENKAPRTEAELMRKQLLEWSMRKAVADLLEERREELKLRAEVILRAELERVRREEEK